MCDLLFIFAQDKLGSFNYTKSAQYRNAENVLVIQDSGLVVKYINNWEKRRKESKKLF